MHSKHLLQQLLVGFAVISTAQATWVDVSKADAKDLARRQLGDLLGGSSSSSTAAATPTPGATPSSSSSSSPAGSLTSTGSSTQETSSHTAPSSTPASTTSSSAGAQESSSTQVSQTSSNPEASATGKQSSTTATPVVSTAVEVVVKTRSDGSKETMTSTSRTTSTPGISSADGDTSGMSTKTRNTVIGVVVGIGGAIVLAALGVVAWRIWGRKKHAEENDGLMAYDMAVTAPEKSERGSSAGGPQRSPFQSNLESYHQPAHVNASSNF